MNARPEPTSGCPAALLDEIKARIESGASRESLQRERELRPALLREREWVSGLFHERSRARAAARSGIRAAILAGVLAMVEGLRPLAETGDTAASAELAAALSFEATLVKLATKESA
jgi:hypothetical protein